MVSGLGWGFNQATACRHCRLPRQLFMNTNTRSTSRVAVGLAYPYPYPYHQMSARPQLRGKAATATVTFSGSSTSSSSNNSNNSNNKTTRRSLSCSSSSSASSSSILFTDDPSKPQSSAIAHIQRLVSQGEASCEDIMRAYLDQMKRLEPHVGSFMPTNMDNTTTTSRSTSAWEDSCLSQARSLDARLSQLSREERDRLYPLAGVPLAVKDNICTKGLSTTAGSRTLAGYVAPGDATVVEKLKAKGCLVIGKTLCDEFGMGSTTESSSSHLASKNKNNKNKNTTERNRNRNRTGPPSSTRNPWDTHFVPGGSSGGSAAAVSARECAVALGTDTGGSVRQPASFCGVVGLKPTYGRVSRYGLVAYASSLDCPGPLANTVEDCALLMDAIAGHDPKDASSAKTPLPPLHEEEEGGGGGGGGGGYHKEGIEKARALLQGADGKPLSGVSIGVVAQTMVDDGRLDERVYEVMTSALKHLEELGARVETVDVPMFDLGLPAYYITAVSEASSNLSRYDGLRYGDRRESTLDLSLMQAISDNRGDLLGDEPLRRILMGTYTLSEGYGDALYKKAQVVRKKVQGEMQEKLNTFDLLLTPTAPTPAYRANKALEDPLQMYLGDIMTVNVNLAGFPAISVPAGLVDVHEEEGEGGGEKAEKNKLPVGVQFIGGPFEEAKLLQVAHIFEKTMALPLVPHVAMH